jgi:hypothetical protein
MTKFHSYALNRDFTEQEWFDYTREHSAHEIVAECYGYQFNIHDVCFNPTQIAEGKSGDVDFQVSVFRAPNGRWGYNYRVQAATSGCYSGSCMARDETMSDTQDEATRKAFDMCKAQLRQYRRTDSASKPGTYLNNTKDVETLCKQIDQHLYDMQHVQLTLF